MSIIGLFWCHLRSEEMRRSGLTGDRLLMEPELNCCALTRILRLHSVLNKLTAFDGSAHWESPRATRRDPPDIERFELAPNTFLNELKRTICFARINSNLN
uniref:Uncharacterized protein n=1 Tax=Macrostomum lignano TaxID=282301 RepID=A0A1I8FNH9_9PLAT